VLQRLIARIRSIWILAKSERASPKQIGWAVFVGVFSGCTPAVGFHGWVALALATLLRLNRLWAWIGSRVSNIVILPFIVWAEIECARYLRTGRTLVLDRHSVLEQAHFLLLDWCIGSVIVGIALGAIFGVLAWVIARCRVRRKLARDRRSSSESPPSSSTAHPS
jgi:hypothetical protein